MRIRTAMERDLPVLAGLLEATGQPQLDGDQPLSDVFVADDDGRVVGGVALETYARSGVVRSLVVAEARRGSGIGRNLWQRLVSRAHELGLESLWLLTLDADGFFAKFGFEPAERNDAPVAIAQSPLFATHCPETAICMRLQLATGF